MAVTGYNWSKTVEAVVTELIADEEGERGVNVEAVNSENKPLTMSITIDAPSEVVLPPPPKKPKKKKVAVSGMMGDTYTVKVSNLKAKITELTEAMAKDAIPMPTPDQKVMEREWVLIRKPSKITIDSPGWAVPEMDYLDGLIVEKSELTEALSWAHIKKKKPGGIGSTNWMLHKSWITPVYTGEMKGVMLSTGTTLSTPIGKWVEARARIKPKQRYLRGECKEHIGDFWYDINALSPNVPVETLGMSVEEWREAYWQVISAAVIAGEMLTQVWEGGNDTHCSKCECNKESECGVGCFCCCNPEKLEAVAWVKSGEMSAQKIAALIKHAAGKGGGGHEEKLGEAGYLTKGMATVYALQHCAYLQIGDQPSVIKALDNTVNELSTRMYNYIGMACLGEARHIGGFKGDGSVMAQGIAAVSGQVGRMESWHAFDLLAEVLEGGERQLLEHLVGIFNSGEWRGGYGGYKWGAVAEVALAFKKGEISAMLFIDTIANMVHNGGWVFNKWYTQVIDCCSTHRSRERHMSHILDAKAQDARKLAGIICLPEPAKSGLMTKTVADEEAVGSLLEKLSVIRRGR